jgi:hypothetical protein
VQVNPLARALGGFDGTHHRPSASAPASLALASPLLARHGSDPSNRVGSTRNAKPVRLPPAPPTHAPGASPNASAPRRSVPLARSNSAPALKSKSQDLPESAVAAVLAAPADAAFAARAEADASAARAPARSSSGHGTPVIGDEEEHSEDDGEGGALDAPAGGVGIAAAAAGSGALSILRADSVEFSLSTSGRNTPVGRNRPSSSSGGNLLDPAHVHRHLWQPRLDVNELALEPGLWLSLSNLHYNVETGEMLSDRDGEGPSKVHSTGLFSGLFGTRGGVEKKHSKGSPSTLFGGLFGKSRKEGSSSSSSGSGFGRIDRQRSKS